MDYQIKTIALKKCARCGLHWSAERILLEPGDQINLDASIRIVFCPSCSDGFSQEIDRPTYRRTGKKIQ